jgi:hypothetical protein
MDIENGKIARRPASPFDAREILGQSLPAADSARHH